MQAKIVAVTGAREIDGGYIFRLRLEWSGEKGYGQIDITQREYPDGEIDVVVDSEFMGDEFVKSVLCKLIDDN